MKFIGQFIQDFIARFRNDVYLEDVSTGTIASGGNLGLDSNNKIVKADTNAGELSITNASDNRVVTSTGGTGLNAESTLTYDSELLTISSTSSSKPTITLLNTNADENAPAFTFLKSGASAADNDTIGTIFFTTTNDAAEGLNFADFVATISDASDSDEGGKIAIRVLADGSLRNFIDGTGVKLDVDGVTHDVVNVNLGYGTESQTVIAGDFSAKGGLLSYANNNLTLDSSTSAKPNLFLSNTNTDAEAPTVTFQKQQTGADNDDIGIIRFQADDAGNNLTSFAEILGEIETAADGSEGGNLILKVASHDGEMQEGIKISDGDAEDEIDVTIGSGSASLTTITGMTELTSGATILGNNYLIFNDNDNSNYTRINSLTTSTNRTIQLPDATGTVALTTDITSDGWHGSTTRIKILPRDFVANDGGRPPMIEDDNVGSNDLFLFSHGTFDMFAYIPIPTGYKATHVRIYGSDTGQDFYVYVGRIISKTIVDVATGATSIGTEKTLGTEVTSDTSNYLIIRVTSDGSTDEIYGGYVTIAAV